MLDQAIEKFKNSNAAQADEVKRLAKEGQKPQAIVVTCADSRVGPEVIFAAGVGELFVIRVAGNVVDDAALASIEYAALALEVPVCYVVGHSGCGAVAETLKWHLHKAKPPTDALEKLVKAIEPNIKNVAQKSLDEKTMIDESTKAHVQHTVISICENSPQLADRIKSGKFAVKGVLFEMNTVDLVWLDS